MIDRIHAACRDILSHRFGADCQKKLGCHVETYIKSLSQLREAAVKHDKRRVRHLTRTILKSFSAKVAGVLRCYGGVFSEDVRASNILTLANELDAFAPVNELIRVQLIAKDFNGIRCVCDFGPRRRALQEICGDILQVVHPLESFDYGARGRGVEAASDKIVEMFEKEGCTHFIIADISNCFGSLEQSGVIKALPFPSNVTSNVLLVTEADKITLWTKDMDIECYIHNNTHIIEWIEQAVRRGIPQGSPASSLIASFLLGPSLKALPCGNRIVLYGDDIVIGACNENEAQAYVEAFKKIMKTHPAGPLELKTCEIVNIRDGFETLKYHYQSKSEGVWRRPSKKSFKRFERRLVGKLKDCDRSLGEQLAVDYTRRWIGSFGRWTKHPNSELFVKFQAQHILNSLPLNGPTQLD